MNALESTLPGRRGRRLLVLLAVVAALVALFYVDRHTGGHLGQLAGWARERVIRFAEWVQGLGPWGPVAFILGYAVATVAFAPGSVLTLSAGILFGLVWGTVYTLIGATLGACAAFLAARYLVRGWVERKLAGKPRFAAIERAVAEEGWKTVALLRLSPVVPFNLLNYALGLTRVPFLHYLAACLAMLPGTLLYVYYGKAIGSFVALRGGAQAERGPELWVFLIVGLAATVAVTAFIARRAKRALGQQLAEPGDRKTAR